MQAILLDILPLAVIAVIGYLAIRFDYVSQAANDGISKFVFVVAIPALIFRNMANSSLADNLGFVWKVLAGYYIGALAVLILAILVGRFLLKAGKADQNILAVGASHSNMVLLGVPVILLLLGREYIMPVALIVGLHGMLMAILLTAVLRVRSGKAGELPSAIWGVIVNQAKNPIFIALVAGIIYDVVGAPRLPAPVNSILLTLGSATYPCALFALGGMMVRYKFGGHGLETATVLALKLVAFPVIVYLLASVVFGLNQWAWVAAMLAAMPVGFNMHNMASRSQNGAAAANSAILLSTILAIVSAAAVLYLRN